MAETNELITFLGFKFQPGSKENLENAKKGVETLKDGIKGLNNFLFGAGGMWNYFKNSVVGGAQSMINLSKQTGISTDNLQRWKYAAEVSGLSFQSLTGDLVEFKKKGQDVMALSKQFASASPRMAQLMKERWGISDDMFILLKEGPEAISKLGLNAPIQDQKELEKTAKLNQEFVKTSMELEKAKNEFMMLVAPQFLSVLKGLNSFMSNNRGFIKWVIGSLITLFAAGKIANGTKALMNILALFSSGSKGRNVTESGVENVAKSALYPKGTPTMVTQGQGKGPGVVGGLVMLESIKLGLDMIYGGLTGQKTAIEKNTEALLQAAGIEEGWFTKKWEKSYAEGSWWATGLTKLLSGATDEQIRQDRIKYQEKYGMTTNNNQQTVYNVQMTESQFQRTMPQGVQTEVNMSTVPYPMGG